MVGLVPSLGFLDCGLRRNDGGGRYDGGAPANTMGRWSREALVIVRPDPPPFALREIEGERRGRGRFLAGCVRGVAHRQLGQRLPVPFYEGVFLSAGPSFNPALGAQGLFPGRELLGIHQGNGTSA